MARQGNETLLNKLHRWSNGRLGRAPRDWYITPDDKVVQLTAEQTRQRRGNLAMMKILKEWHPTDSPNF